MKLHGAILDSSVWEEPHATRIVWITMLAMADQDGVVQASVGGLARRALVTIQECQKALATFLSPDPDSRDETAGERIAKVPGGWFVLNHAQYRDKRTDAQIKTAARVARHRAAKKAAARVTHVTPRNDLPLPDADAEYPSAGAPDGEGGCQGSGESAARHAGAVHGGAAAAQQMDGWPVRPARTGNQKGEGAVPSTRGNR